MSDIFTKSDALKLLQSKHIIFFGDSNFRALYKDVIWLLNHNSLITEAQLKKKLELSFEGDDLVDRSELHKGRDFKEVRNYKKHGVHIEFYFITRCYTNVIENMMKDVKEKKITAPDVIVINSLLWDITRWGPNGVTEYKDNLMKLMKLFKASLPSKTLVIWTTSLPISKSCYGGFLVKQVEFLKHTLRFEVMEANIFARQIVVSHGFDVLDLHHYLRMQIHRRTGDGIHWHPLPMRHMTNLLLTHIALSWNHPLPGNFESSMQNLLNGENQKEEPVVFPSVPVSLTDVAVSPVQLNAALSPLISRRPRRLPPRLRNQENYIPNNVPTTPYWMDTFMNEPAIRPLNLQSFMTPSNHVMNNYYMYQQFPNYQTHQPGPIHNRHNKNKKRHAPYNM
ncbi:hypothetical protein L9F63_016669 [Diploptera punctata]|uniref:Uncharacterized protein n=1 Tax=Diploptera punctata TaxID=6984 RepID=A0AAD8EHK8_DIPPU|nr:hypothetical protein L9F63_016669 [Diploptera punctata]